MAPRSSLPAVAIAGLLAVLLAVLAVPSLIAASLTLGANDPLERVRMHAKTLPPPMVLTEAAQASERAAHIFDSGRYRANAAAALMAMKPADRPSTGLDLEKEIRRSLADAPSSTYNWNRLSALRYYKGDREGALKAWEMSVLTGRYAPNVVNARIFLALRMFPIKDRELLDMLIDQIHLSADADVVELARTSYIAGGAPFVQAVLWQDTDLAPEFTKAYRILLLKERRKLRRGMDK